MIRSLGPEEIDIQVDAIAGCRLPDAAKGVAGSTFFPRSS